MKCWRHVMIEPSLRKISKLFDGEAKEYNQIYSESYPENLPHQKNVMPYY